MAVSDIAASDIVETVPSALIILDRNLNITSANRAFYQTFRTSANETEGCLIYDLGNRQWDIPALRTLLESVIPHRASVEGFEVEHDFPTIGRRTMLVNARKIFRPGDHDGFILLAIEDVSEERAARKESKRNWQLTNGMCQRFAICWRRCSRKTSQLKVLRSRMIFRVWAAVSST